MIDPNDERTQNEKDLTLLVLRLVRSLEKHEGKTAQCTLALEYLKSKNLLRATDILR